VSPGRRRAAGAPAPGRLLPILGIGFGLAVIIGNTIAAGILRTPGQVAAYLPDTGLFLAAWVVGGIYALLGAIQLSELGAMLSRSGGQYVFARYALGEYAGFVVGWSDWISTCGSTAAVAIVAGEFTAALIPPIEGRAPAVAAAIAFAFTLAQWRGIREGSRVQNVTSVMKTAAFLVLIAAAFVAGGGAAAPEAEALPVPAGLAMAGAFLLALQGVIFTYDGWSAAIYFSEEARDPGRDIPRSMIGGVLLVIAVYLLVNLAILHVLPLSAMAGEEFAAGAAAAAIFGERGDEFFRVLTVVSMLSAVNALQLMASRVIFAMSRDGLVSARIAAVNAGGTPTVALFLSFAIGVLFIALGRTFEQVITVLSFFFVANYALSFIAVFVLRRREPDRARPYRAWGYPWTTGLALAGSILFLAGAVAGDTRNSLYALLVLAASYPIFRLMR
jgi:APA family basic amino acid/polyamine antiporter